MNPEPIDLEELERIVTELGLGESYTNDDYNPAGMTNVCIGAYTDDLANKVGQIHYMDATIAHQFVTVLQALPQLIALARASEKEK